MKKLIAKLKGLKYKQLAIDHGEKGLLGLVGLFVLISLAGTSWSRYDKMPEEFLKKAKEGEDNIKASTWTPEKKKEFESARDISVAVQKLHSPIEPGRFDYQTNWYWPMYAQQERVKEPRLLAAVETIGDFGRLIVQELPPETQHQMLGKPDEPTDDGAPSKAAESDYDLAPNRPNRGESDPRALGRGGASIPAFTDLQMEDTAVGTATPYPNPYGVPGMATATGKGINARGVRFVAVRSVFPLKDQIDEFVKALHEQIDRAAEFVDFLNFELERQVAIAGNDPWSGKWEAVDINVALELLDRVDFDTELVDLAYTDAVFTMPLPRRAGNAGTWKKFASHPKIKELDLEHAQAQERINRKLIAEAEERELKAKGGKAGFYGKTHDVRHIRSHMFSGGGMTNMMNMMADMSRDFSTAEGSTAESREYGSFRDFSNQMQKTNARLSKYLLFRYFDFDVAPGNAYRYRVRFVLRNPNHKRPVEQLVDAAVAEGEQRTTPWSEPTTPVIVPEEQNVFLANAYRARPEAGTVLPSAKFDIFQWFADTGTFIMATTKDSLQLGQFVGGRLKTEVLRPAAETFDEEEVSVFTGSVLTDIVAAPFPELDPVEHADLKVDPKKLKNLGTVDKALLVDRYGQLVTLDPKSTTNELSQAERTIKNQRENWKHLKDRERKFSDPYGGGTADSYDGAGYEPSMDPMEMMMMMSPLKRSPPGSGRAKPSPKGSGKVKKPVRREGPGG